MRILIVTPTEGDRGLGYFYKKAFMDLGHDVLIHGVQRISYTPSLRERVVQRVARLRPLREWPATVQFNRLLAAAQEFSPDLILVTRCERLSSGTVKELSDIASGRIANIYPDSPMIIPGLQDMNCLDALSAYHTVFTFSRSLIPVFYQLGARKVAWLPFAYDPDTHRKTDSNYERQYNVSYFGTWGRLQEKWLSEIQHYGLKIFGMGWSRLKRGSPLRPCWIQNAGIGPAMAEEIGRSKIVFNLIRAEHGCAHSMKTFEILACGGFMVTNWTEEQSYFFEDGKDCVFFLNAKELCDKLSFYLKNNSARRRIVERVMKTVQRHTYLVRAATLLDYFKRGAIDIEVPLPTQTWKSQKKYEG